MNTSKLTIGQEFKNLQELSLYLTGKKIPSGKARTLMINKMKQYFSYETITGTHKIVIKEIYPEQKVTLNKNAKYLSQVLINLSTLDLSKSYTKYELYELLGITNERFTNRKYYVSNINSFKLSVKEYDKIHRDIDLLLSNMLNKVLNNISDKGFASVSNEYEFDISNTKIPMEDIISKALAAVSCQSEWIALHSSKRQVYNDTILKSLAPYGVTKYHKVYKFSNIHLPYGLPENSKEAMNALVVQKLKKHFLSQNSSPKIFRIIDSLIKV